VAAALGAGGVLVFSRMTAPVTTVADPATPSGEPTRKPAIATASPTAQPGKRLPQGWRTHRNADGGFSIALPRGWRAVKHATRNSVTLSGPGTPGQMIVEWTVPEGRHDGPVAHWRALERDILDKGDFPGYRRIAIRPLTYLGREAADWEFTRPRDGTLIHVINRGFRAAGDRPYALYWETPHGRWKRDRHYFETFVRTFRPGPA
jgi:eukaryotic-like serine/threonine-protein kinase